MIGGHVGARLDAKRRVDMRLGRAGLHEGFNRLNDPLGDRRLIADGLHPGGLVSVIPDGGRDQIEHGIPERDRGSGRAGNSDHVGAVAMALSRRDAAANLRAYGVVALEVVRDPLGRQELGALVDDAGRHAQILPAVDQQLGEANGRADDELRNLLARGLVQFLPLERVKAGEGDFLRRRDELAQLSQTGGLVARVLLGGRDLAVDLRGRDDSQGGALDLLSLCRHVRH